MFHAPINARGERFSPFAAPLSFGARPAPFPAPLDLCRDQVPAAEDCDGLRFAAAARKLACGQAFRPAFATGDWRVFASFCIARRLAAGHRVMIAGRADRTLRFVVEGSLWQECASGPRRPKVLQAGAILGEDALFSDATDDLDVRTLEDSLLLDLSLPRQKELTAACPEIGFELLRAAGAVIAARGRAAEGRDELATN